VKTPEEKYVSYAMLCDLSEAFDAIDHNTLLHNTFT